MFQNIVLNVHLFINCNGNHFEIILILFFWENVKCIWAKWFLSETYSKQIFANFRTAFSKRTYTRKTEKKPYLEKLERLSTHLLCLFYVDCMSTHINMCRLNLVSVLGSSWFFPLPLPTLKIITFAKVIKKKPKSLLPMLRKAQFKYLTDYRDMHCWIYS